MIAHAAGYSAGHGVCSEAGVNAMHRAACQWRRGGLRRRIAAKIVEGLLVLL
jgi:hypothetical protein